MLMVGNGLSGAVLGVRTVSEGFSAVTTGLIITCYFAGFLVSPSVVLRWLAGVGHIRVFAALASTASASVLIHSISVTPVTWAVMRFVFGFCMAGLYMVIESWLNDASTPQNRGRTLAVYMLVSMAGLAGGQFLIAVADTAGFRLFVVASVLVSMALVPMALAATTDAPPVRAAEPLSLVDLYRTVPTGLFGMFFTGASHGVLLGLGAVYATRVGFSAERTATYLAVATLGALVLQWPIGWISDRVGRRGVILAVAIGAVLASLGLALVSPASMLVLPIIGVLSGFTFPLYSLLVSYTIDWTEPGKSMGATGTLLRVNGAGAVVGPLLAASLMGAFDEAMFYWTMVATHGAIVAYVGYRVFAADPLPMDRQGDFIPMPARATALAVRMTSRPLKASRAALRRRKLPD
jgi:MFS family permease